MTVSYHSVSFLYTGYYLRAQSIAIQSATCDISITWNHPYLHADFVTGYEVYLQEKNGDGWKSSEKIYAGNHTSYTSPCTLQSGRLYRIYIRTLVLLSNPTQTITVDTSFYETILGKTNHRNTFVYVYIHVKWFSLHHTAIELNEVFFNIKSHTSRVQ